MAEKKISKNEMIAQIEIAIRMHENSNILGLSAYTKRALSSLEKTYGAYNHLTRAYDFSKWYMGDHNGSTFQTADEQKESDYNEMIGIIDAGVFEYTRLVAQELSEMKW